MAGIRDALRQTKWHFTPTESYGMLGWFQAVVRLLGIAVALLSWIQFIIDGERSQSELMEQTPQRIAEIVVIILILLLYIWKMFLVVISAEAMAFGIHVLNCLADIMIMLDIFLQFDPSAYVFLFALCLVMAEMLQIMFLFMRSKEHIAQHFGLSTLTLWVYSGLAAFLYIVLLIIQVVIYTTTYQQFHGY